MNNRKLCIPLMTQQLTVKFWLTIGNTQANHFLSKWWFNYSCWKNYSPTFLTWVKNRKIFFQYPTINFILQTITCYLLNTIASVNFSCIWQSSQFKKSSMWSFYEKNLLCFFHRWLYHYITGCFSLIRHCKLLCMHNLKDLNSSKICQTQTLKLFKV